MKFNLSKLRIDLFVMYFFIMLILLSTWLYRFYPGILNGDSILDINFAQKHDFLYWRSYLYSLYLFIGYFFNFQTSIYSLFQIFIICLIGSYVAKQLHPLAPKSTLLFIILLCAWPLNGVYSVHIIRDVLSSWLTMLAAIELFLIFQKSKKPFFCIFLTASLALLRPENILMSCILIILLFYKFRKNKSQLKFLILFQFISLLLFYIFLPPIVGAKISRIQPFGSRSDKPRYMAISLLNPLQETIQNMSESELKNINLDYLNKFIDVEKLKSNSNPLQADMISINLARTNDEIKTANNYILKIIMSKPLTLIKSRCKLFWATIGFHDQTYWLHEENNKDRTIKWPFGVNDNYTKIMSSLFFHIIFSFILLFNIRKYPMTFVSLFFINSRLLMVFLFSPAPHFSYVYSSFLITFLLVPMMLNESPTLPDWLVKISNYIKNLFKFKNLQPQK